MGKRIAVVVVVDGLRADGLACYGNARAQTPFLDRLAAESVVFDFAFCLDPTLESFYRSAVLGVHPVYGYAGQGENALRHMLRPAIAELTDDPNVAAAPLANASGFRGHYLVTDDPAVAAIDVAPFEWSEVCTGTPAASDLRGSHADEASFFASAASWLSGRFGSAAAERAIAWVHTSLITRQPISSREAAETLTARRQYDAAVTAIDEGIRTLFDELTFPDDAECVLLVVIGARGYSLGERGNVGVEPVVLHEELLHVPLIVHDVRRRSDPFRTPQLTSPLDLCALVSGWLSVGLDFAAPLALSTPSAEGGTAAAGAWADWLLFATAHGDRALRTPGWYLIRPSAASASPGEGQGVSPLLYLKPDDRWEFNEVCDRRPEIAAALSERLDDLLRQSAGGDSLTLPPLPADLVKGG